MSYLLRIAPIALVSALLATIPACRNNSNNKITIGVVTNCTADFWSICEAGANKAAKEHNADLQFRQPEKPFDAALQMQIVEAWAKQGVSGMAVSVIDPDAQTEDLTRIAKKVPLITMDNDADKSGRRCYIGIDNYEAGKAVGWLVKRALPDGGTVALFIGSTKSANGKSRTQGVLDELAGQKDAQGEVATHPLRPDLEVKNYGKYYLIDRAPKEDNGQANAQSIASGVLGRVKGLPNLCMVGLYAYNPPAILEVAKARSMAGEIKIVGFDEDWETLKGIENGEIDATVVQDPFRYGYVSVRALATKNFDVAPIPYRIVTKNGGKHEMINGATIENLKVADFADKLRADLESAKK